MNNNFVIFINMRIFVLNSYTHKQYILYDIL